ncbi:MAG: helix-turn-helix domain-containing protein [Prevotellaceae bacterium]|jgi:DNA-binding Xre family transcriptional regulator|nr:helix-turn-helix domain-containing protein [Prevotellaceae bacterium]
MDKETTLIKIGLKIRKLRQERNLSITELSDKIEIEYNNLIRIEKGRTNFTVGTLLKVCKALNVRLIDIVNVD